VGLYEELQNDIGEAFDTDLADAVRNIDFITVVDVYDPVTMETTQTQTTVTVRGVVESDFEGERIDEATLNNNIKILVMDRDKDTLEFYVDMIIKDGTESYKLKAFNSDPAKASWTVYARRLG